MQHSTRAAPLSILFCRRCCLSDFIEDKPMRRDKTRKKTIKAPSLCMLIRPPSSVWCDVQKACFMTLLNAFSINGDISYSNLCLDNCIQLNRGLIFYQVPTTPLPRYIIIPRCLLLIKPKRQHQSEILTAISAFLAYPFPNQSPLSKC